MSDIINAYLDPRIAHLNLHFHVKYAILSQLNQNHGQTNSTYTDQKQIYRRGLLDAQKQEESRAQGRTQEIQCQAQETRRLQGGQKIIISL
jgi:hypothetical protein